MSSNDAPRNESFAAMFEADPNKQTHVRRHLAIGQEVEGIVAKVTHDTIFMDLDGKREAFIDLASMTDRDGTTIQIAVGDHMRARVAEIGGKAGAIRLEPVAVRRAVEEETSEPAGTGDVLMSSGPALAVGAKVEGTVTRIENYGVFVQIKGTAGREGRGLVPNVESGLPRGADTRKHFTIGQALTTKIVAIDETGKIRLSIKALQADEERADFDKFGGKAPTPDGRPRGFGTLGDLLRSGGSSKAKKK